ncbi:hypothetical protein HPP92_002242 [Vanilla planifolia]|uniref:Calcineurin-like phosphoesterase domain-containing protein n=1 Tax=Vanilla planifolia TaxID=51239 RepID=A0A835RZV6_VANPL|nr:hypothetical protein HPP92_002242 [Vanilla planifolia]
MQSLSRLTLVLCVAWVLTLLYGEMVAYWIPLWTCSWPRPDGSLSSLSGNEVKVAVIADPQIMDRTSLNLAPKSFALEAAQFFTDLYMRRSFHLSILPFKPNLVIFLGDHFDGGPFLTDQEWSESLNRFKHIFDLEGHGRYSNIAVYYVCGNHDIGYSHFHMKNPEVIHRYEKEFGARNYRFSAGKVDFIVVDAQTLDGAKQGKEADLSWQFIKNISSDVTSSPRVLLTHIPLYRLDDTPCGIFRSSSIINQRVTFAGVNQGMTYQNYLTKESSDHLLNLIKPVLVLSGHDHDHCTVTHSTQFGPIVEHTLGTISWQQGNLYPSFMLLTVSPSNSMSSAIAVSTRLCFLPRQTHIYIWYLCQLVVTLLLMLLWPANAFAFFGPFVAFFDSLRSNLIKAKEKVEEDDCEYEMIWDSEGSMHLIKKNKTVPLASSDVGSSTRGNAVLRTSAKKQPTREQDPSVFLEMNIDMNSDKTGRVQRPSRSKVMRLILRLVRVFRLIVLVAAVNVPLYMMLLFKDWVGR